MSNPPPRKPKAMLLGEQTARTYFANIAHVYRHHFGVIVSCSGLPYVLPATILTLALINLNPEQPQPALIAAVFVGLGLGYLGLFLTAAVLSVVLSDICLGNVPTVKRHLRTFSGSAACGTCSPHLCSLAWQCFWG